MERDKIGFEYILITSMNFPSGGAGATYLNLFCRGLKDNGCKIRVFLLKGHAFGNFGHKKTMNNISEDGIPYTYLGFRYRPKNMIFKLLEEFVSIACLIVLLFSFAGKSRRIKLLVYNSEFQYNLPIYLVVKLLGIKRSVFVAEIIDKSEYGTSFRRLVRMGHLLNFKYLNRKSDKLMLFSHYLKNEYVKMGYDEKNIIVQPNLTDFKFWEPVDQEIKYSLGYSGAPYLKDGLSDLFKSIKILKDKNINVTLLVIGDIIFGKSLIPALEKECEELGISQYVTFTGLVESSQVKKYMLQCQILAITRPDTIQTKAGFPTKLGEYIATKKPILTTNFGDMEKYFTDGLNIVMASCGDPESIADKINWMLENKEELELIAKRGYDVAYELLEYRRSVKRINCFLACN